MYKIPIEISARHAHLSKQDLETLFGQGYELKKMKDLSQRGQFAAQEQITLKGPKGEISGVRVMGPCRSKTQVEISKTDARALGISAPVRLSGEAQQSAGIELTGPKGSVKLTDGVIVALRHIHCDPKTANEIGIRHGETVAVEVEGERALIFNNVAVRTDPTYELAMHIDTDEANCAGIDGENKMGEIIIL